MHFMEDKRKGTPLAKIPRNQELDRQNAHDVDECTRHINHVLPETRFVTNAISEAISRQYVGQDL